MHTILPLHKSHLNKRRLSETIHLLLALIALGASFLLRFEFHLDPASRNLLWTSLPLFAALTLVIFRLFGLRDLAWRYTGFRDLLRLAAACFSASLAAGVAMRVSVGPALPRSLPILDFVLSLALLAGAHALAKAVYESRGARGLRPSKRVAVYGAGKAGWTLVSEIHLNPQMGYEVVGFLDDDPAKLGLRLQGVRVLGGRLALQAQVKARRIELVLIALPQVSGAEMTSILEECHRARVEEKEFPLSLI